jgi:hypothetical protein
MSSVLTEGFKQSHGYFLVIATTGVASYDIAAGSGAGGSFLPGAATTPAAGVPAIAAGQILRDMGKTVLVGGIANTAGAASSAGTVGVPLRVFRKVQLLNSAGANGLAANAPNGVSGNATSYFTFYIELPTLGRSGSSANNALGGQFTYVNSLPGLYV